ncbi:hypothetical protein SAMN05443247_01728 [Bradyrhizobium erythrophlei]|jgi:hypothetical protein|nr:hypothetical protein SAMN05443247_01728 [Bradyrhizobium erythrophlei]
MHYRLHLAEALSHRALADNLRRAAWPQVPDGQINQFAVKTFLRKNSSYSVGQITARSSPHPGPKEGRFAIVTNVGSGMRWTRQRRRANG